MYRWCYKVYCCAHRGRERVTKGTVNRFSRRVLHEEVFTIQHFFGLSNCNMYLDEVAIWGVSDTY